MTATVEVVGVYPVSEAEPPVSLVELWIRGYFGTVDFAKFSQVHPELAPAHEQVAYLEHMLNEEGTSGKSLSYSVEIDKDSRLAFFVHYLDTMQPLNTQWGPVLLPQEVARPPRLTFIEYFEP